MTDYNATMKENSPLGSEAPPYDGYHKYDWSVAKNYERDRNVEAHWWHEDQFIKSHLGPRQINSLLDLPVGTGRFVRHYTGVSNLVGVDISEEMLKEARKKLTMLSPQTTARFEYGDIFALRFADATFDVTIVWRLFHLLPPDLLAKAVKELCRVTCKEIVVQTYVPLPMTLWRVRFRRVAALLRRAISFMGGGTVRRWFWSRVPKTDPTPWCHIRSFSHKQTKIDYLFEEQGFVRQFFNVLDKYEGTEVRATVYSRP